MAISGDDVGTLPSQTIRWLRVVNLSSTPVPPFGAMEIAGVADDGGIQIQQPSVSNGTSILFNGIAPIDPYDSSVPAEGQGTQTYPCIAAYQAANPPLAGEHWGVVAGSWFLQSGRTGFTIVGGSANGFTNVMLTGGSGGGGSVTSVDCDDNSLLVSPTTGDVNITLNTDHENVWTAPQEFDDFALLKVGDADPADALSYADGVLTCGSNHQVVSGSETIFAYTLPANAFTSAGSRVIGRMLTLTMGGVLGSSGDLETFTIKLAGNTVGTINVTPLASNDIWELVTVLFYTGSGINAFQAYSKLSCSSITLTAKGSSTYAGTTDADFGVVANPSSGDMTTSYNRLQWSAIQ